MEADVLERTDIEVLLTLADELHFGRTADRLRLSTGQVSRIVKRLERRIGAPLFTRTSRTVALTPIGERLVVDLRPLVAQIDEAERRAIDSGRGVDGELRVGFVGAAASQALLKAVARFGDRHRDCQVRIHEAQLHDACERVMSGQLDVLITALPVEGVRVGPVLFTEPLVLAVPEGDRLARGRETTREAFAARPVIQPKGLPDEAIRYRIPAVTPSGRPVRPGPTAETFSEILALVATGQGICPVGAHAARFHPRPGVAYLPITDAPELQWAPVWLESNETSRVRAFVECAAQDVHDG
jgi:DNA-binding transcriptional LysR family regulator